MSEVKPLSADAVALLLRLTDPKASHSNWKITVAEEGAANELYDARLVGAVPSVDHWVYPPNRLGKTVAATITNERQQAAEGERRRIAGLLDGVYDEIESRIDAGASTTLYPLEAFTESLNKGQTNGD